MTDSNIEEKMDENMKDKCEKTQNDINDSMLLLSILFEDEEKNEKN